MAARTSGLFGFQKQNSSILRNAVLAYALMHCHHRSVPWSSDGLARKSFRHFHHAFRLVHTSRRAAGKFQLLW